MATRRTGTILNSDSGIFAPYENTPIRRGNSKWGSNPMEYWSRILRKQAKSQLTVKAFCKEEGFSTCSFYTWRKRLHYDNLQRDSSFSDRTNFVELIADDSDSGVRVAIGNQVQISVARNFDAETFRSALSVVCDVLQ